jgi:hypothetical protein
MTGWFLAKYFVDPIRKIKGGTWEFEFSFSRKQEKKTGLF